MRLTADDRLILEYVAENDPNGPGRDPLPVPLQVPLQHERVMVALARAALDLVDGPA